MSDVLTSGGRVAIVKAMREQGFAIVAGADMKRIVRNMAADKIVTYHETLRTNRRNNGERQRSEWKVTFND